MTYSKEAWCRDVKSLQRIIQAEHLELQSEASSSICKIGLYTGAMLINPRREDAMGVMLDAFYLLTSILSQKDLLIIKVPSQLISIPDYSSSKCAPGSCVWAQSGRAVARLLQAPQELC